MNLKDRFKRQDNEDIIILGEIIEKTMRSDFGTLLKLMVNNLKSMEISNSRYGNGNSDKVLGRLEAYETLMSDIYTFVEKKAELQTPIPASGDELPGAQEQMTAIRGGEV